MNTSVMQHEDTAARIEATDEKLHALRNRMQPVKKFAHGVYRGYQVLAFVVVLSLLVGYTALFKQEYRDMLLPYKSNVYTKSCRATFGKESDTPLEGTRTVYDRYQSFGPLTWINKDESTETTKVTLRGESLTVIGQTGTELDYTKVFSSKDGDQQIKPTETLIFVRGSKQEVAIVPYAEFCK